MYACQMLDTTGNGMVELEAIYDVLCVKQVSSEKYPYSPSHSASSHDYHLRWRQSVIEDSRRQEDKPSGPPDSADEMRKHSLPFNFSEISAEV